MANYLPDSLASPVNPGHIPRIDVLPYSAMLCFPPYPFPQTPIPTTPFPTDRPKEAGQKRSHLKWGKGTWGTTLGPAKLTASFLLCSHIAPWRKNLFINGPGGLAESQPALRAPC